MSLAVLRKALIVPVPVSGIKRVLIIIKKKFLFRIASWRLDLVSKASKTISISIRVGMKIVLKRRVAPVLIHADTAVELIKPTSTSLNIPAPA